MNIQNINKSKLTLLFLLMLSLPFFVMAEFKISEYKYYKELDVKDKNSSDYNFIVDEDIYKNSPQFLFNIRVIDENNKEIPYKIAKKHDKIEKKWVEKNIKIISKKGNVYTLDLGKEGKYIKNIKVKTSSIEYSRVIDVFGSNLADARFTVLTDKGGEVISNTPSKIDNDINFKYTKYRFLKVILSGNEGNFKLDNFYTTEIEEKKIAGIKENFDLDVTQLTPDTEGQQKILITKKRENIPVDNLILNSSSYNFEREVEIYTSNNKDSLILKKNKRYNKDKSYWKKIYNGKYEKKAYLENQKFKIEEDKKYILIIIKNRDNQEIKINSASAERFLDILYLERSKEKNKKYRVFYGKNFLNTTSYDKSNIFKSNEIRSELSEEKINSLYKEPKGEIKTETPYLIYIFLFFLIVILAWFVYKIMREAGAKDKESKVKKNIDKI